MFVEVIFGSGFDDTESAEPRSDQDRANAERLMSLMQVDRFIDLPNPMLYSR